MNIRNKWEFVGPIQSEKGFFIGDPCYVLSDKNCERLENETISSGLAVELPSQGGNQFQILVRKTDLSDLKDNYGDEFWVDSGLVGVVPVELVAEGDTEGGLLVKMPGCAYLNCTMGDKYNVVIVGQDGGESKTKHFTLTKQGRCRVQCVESHHFAR